MDKDKAIEAVKELVQFLSEREFYYIHGNDNGRFYLNNIGKVQALKEALEEKPSREDIIKKLEEHDVLSQDYAEYVCHAIDLLKQPTMQWVEWSGGKCPVDNDINGIMVIRYRDGETRLIDNPQVYRWEHTGSCSDIIAYMIIE